MYFLNNLKNILNAFKRSPNRSGGAKEEFKSNLLKTLFVVSLWAANYFLKTAKCLIPVSVSRPAQPCTGYFHQIQLWPAGPGLAGAASHRVITTSSKPILGDTQPDVWDPGAGIWCLCSSCRALRALKFALYFHIMIFIIFALSL